MQMVFLRISICVPGFRRFNSCKHSALRSARATYPVHSDLLEVLHSHAENGRAEFRADEVTD
jgi:hypothetical protein